MKRSCRCASSLFSSEPSYSGARTYMEVAWSGKYYSDAAAARREDFKLSGLEGKQSIRLSSALMHPTIQARLKFLDAAAHLYSSTAPATSAQLMRERQDFVADNEIKLREAEVRGSCQACGTISTSQNSIVSGPIKSSKSRSQHRKRGGNDQGGGEAHKTAIRKCLACHRSTRIPMLLPSKPSERNVGRPSNAQDALQPDSLPGKKEKLAGGPLEDESPHSANSSSKKRAKARKPGGLQAILDKHETTQRQSSGFYLDLMDIMKSA